MALKTEREKGAHLLRRFGLGASEAELDYYLQKGLNGAIDRLLNYEQHPEGFEVPIEFMLNQNNNYNPQQVGVWWALRMVMTQRPLQEKMVLFWHDHFATSGSKVNAGPLMHQHNETLREHATGNFRTLLTAVSQDPAMLFWLDNQYNVKGKPNENFAREVMELFTLGVDQGYTEKDIQEAARAFTGWTIGRPNQRQIQQGARPRGTFLFRKPLHDDGVKTVIGKTGNLTGEEVIDHLCSIPRTSEYLVLKLWEWFAYPKPEESLVKRLAIKFRQSDLNLKVLLRDIMTAPEFYSEKAERKVYKNPVDFLIPTLRQLGFAQVLGEAVTALPEGEAPQAQRARILAPAQVGSQVMKSMGMHLLFPPDVAGWEHGQAWISSATMVERLGWADKLFGTNRAGRLRLNYQAFPLFSEDATPEGVVKKLVSIFDAPIPAAKMPTLVEAARAASGGQVTRQNANATAGAVARLIFASPEFQFA